MARTCSTSFLCCPASQRRLKSTQVLAQHSTNRTSLDSRSNRHQDRTFLFVKPSHHRHRHLISLTAASTDHISTTHPHLPSLTRLQREAQRLVAIDVEYVHIKITPTGQRYQLPAEICLVDYQGNIMFHTFCNGFDAYSLDPETLEFEFKGGIPRRDWLSAPKLKEIKPKLVEILGSKDVPVVGHNLGKDLTSLGLDKAVPLQRRRDTMRYAALQGPSGFGRTLAELARKKLHREIQVESRHDPAEDAFAAMDLYLKYCHYDPDLMEYDDLVEYYASQMLDTSKKHDEEAETIEKLDSV